ncbi:DEP domain-containing protein 1A isoform X2 [Nelusetta ayraudi]|uniref:DEP domain-containing protein 1A isoform X2 n=1 Tax=Nelusetta ayraudi TaxID=303726 RepID=UPI003F6E9C6E
MSSHVITPGPYRATKLWNEVTRLFRAGMPLRKHRQNFRHYASCFTASAAVDWLHELLCSNSNFGPEVTRQQTVQLLKKFLKNHVIEDVKGRWGSEDLEDNNTLYRFPSTSPLKRIPSPAKALGSARKRSSFSDKEGFFKFKTFKKQDKETQENVDPSLESERENKPLEEAELQRRELTLEDEQQIWKDITLTHLKKILGVSSLDDVLDQCHVSPQNIIHNMTKVNKHGVVTLEDKTDDLPHWVLNAMKSLANWPKYDSEHPSYPGFERDVFKTVSDYFYSLPQPLLTYELYELFINVLVFCGYVTAPKAQQQGKRKRGDAPPAKASFRSTECLLLSLLKQSTCDETESPMREVLGGKLQSLMSTPRAGGGGEGHLGGSRATLSALGFSRPHSRSCSLENILDDSAPLTRQQLFASADSLASRDDGPVRSAFRRQATNFFPGAGCQYGPRAATRKRPASLLLGRVPPKTQPQRPRSVGSCLDMVAEETGTDCGPRRRSSSCLSVSSPSSSSQTPPLPPSSSSSSISTSTCASSSSPAKARGSDPRTGPCGPRAASSTCNLWTLSAAPTVARRCLSSLELSKPARPASLFRTASLAPASSSTPPQPKPENSLLKPQSEAVAVEALQLCTLLLPPTSRRKLQLLMRMMSRISQNVDMPRLHTAIGTRTLMIHTFSGCVLGSAVECDLDELLATRLVSFLMDHQQSILSVPEYLLNAINSHVRYLRSVQVPVNGDLGTRDVDPACTPLPIHTFCSQISSTEFEQQKLAASQKAMEELLEMLVTDQSISQKERHKKLKQFQKLYPEIYRRRFPPSERESSKPKIKPPLLSIKKAKAFGIRN